MSLLRLCGYCRTWNGKPCGEQCCLSPSDPTWDSLTAQVGRNPEGGDPQGLRAEHEHAVGSEAGDAPPPSNTPIPTTKTAEDHSEEQP